ncbi:MAG: EamA family transporter RarD [Acidobacteria bacterium]|nr:EamA family transporter RarD [Acidobacteriota bacterium]
MSSELRKGAWYAAVAYGVWGFVPIYWKWLQEIPALQLICHRIIWSSVLLLALVARSRDWSALRHAARSRRVVGIYAAAAIVVGINWFVYVWAVNAGFIVQTALGYFINPLVSVFLGVIVFRETLRRWQWVAIGLACSGVLALTVSYGSLPWIALALAFSFGAYGLLKKMAPLGAINGLALETSILFVPAAVYLIYVDHQGTGGFGHAGGRPTLLMISAGPVTTIPLLFFAAAVRRVPLSAMGMLQYINPTMQFLIGVLMYKEPFAAAQFVGFGMVWAALAVYALEGYLTRRWYPVQEAS